MCTRVEGRTFPAGDPKLVDKGWRARARAQWRLSQTRQNLCRRFALYSVLYKARSIGFFSGI